MSEIFDKKGNSLAGGLGSKVRNPGAPAGNQNAAKKSGELLDTSIHIACTKREKSAWVKAARGPLPDWVRSSLNKASGKSD